MSQDTASFYGLKAFALTGVRCVRLERGYLPHNHFHHELEPIHEDKIIDPARKPVGPRRSPSPISVLTNGSFRNDKNKMAPGNHSTGSKHAMIRRSSRRKANYNSSVMLNDMMGRKHRRKSMPSLSSFKSSNVDVEEGIVAESDNNTLHSLVIETSSVTNNENSLTAEVTSFSSRSSIYQGHIGSMTLQNYILDPTSRQEPVETFRRPITEENDTKVNIICLPEKKTSKRLFLLCFGVFVSMVIIFLVSITSGLLFPDLLVDRQSVYHETPHNSVGVSDVPSNFSMTGASQPYTDT